MAFQKWMVSLLSLSALLAAGDQPWKDKQVSDWTEEDAKQVLTDSPWVKTVKPEVDRSPNSGQRRSGGGMGRGGGIGIGGIGIGLPGIGIGRRGGMGYPGGGYPGGGYPGGGGPGGHDPQGNGSRAVPELKLRWESALPVREAELKVRETNAPDVDDGHYAIAVYGVPARMAEGDTRAVAGRLKKLAYIKRDGKKDLKPSSVEVLQRNDGPVIVYLFPRSTEISRQDKGVEFTAQIARLKFAQSFFVSDMVYRDKLEL